VAAENFWGDIAKQIGGNHVEVTSLISDPNTDPHLFESNPQAIAEVANAQLVITNGFGYDPFMDKLLATGGRADRAVATMASRVPGVAGEDPNPHLWYWTAQVPRFAALILIRLEQIDPEHEAVFQAGLHRFNASLAPLVATLRQIRHGYKGVAVGVTERLSDYLLREAGLTIATPESFSQSLEDGNDPSPGDLVTSENAIKNHTIKVLIYNEQVVDAATERLKDLAISSGVPVVGMTETMPLTDASFQAWQLRQARELLRALGG
jgi:zinc/manganese transport system substrate-binding protein